MPIVKGDTPAAIGHNIKMEQQAGKGKAQALAIALHTAKDEAYAPVNAMTLQEINERNRVLWQGTRGAPDCSCGTVKP